MNRPTAKVAPRLEKAVTQQALITAPKPAELGELAHPMQWLDAAWRYQVDLFQRGVLFLDTLRERADDMIDHERAGLPPLLNFDYEIILDARRFEHPANYALLRITVSGSDRYEECVGENKPPVIIVDPRAGHGPGIGGFKRDSEMGMALHEGHPVYFVIFFPEPCPGQTLADVLHALRRFVEEVQQRHGGKAPVLYGNCQAGWAITLLSADCAGLVGPAVLNGSPLSYWTGESDVNPMRTRRYLFSEKFSPWMAGIKALAPWVRDQRRPVAEDNPYVELEKQFSQQSQSLDNYRHLRDHAYEMLFKVVYG